MTTLGDTSSNIRSKNAGPFWATIDIFFDDQQDFEHASQRLQTGVVARLMQVPEEQLKRFDLADILVIKISFPRPIVQGHIRDRDMHGAQYAWLLSDIALD
jgi:hypothetical protein